MTEIYDACIVILHDMDDKLTPTSEGWNEHILLIASSLMGADENELAEALEFDLKFCRIVASRLRAASIWNNSSLLRLDAWKKDGLSFFLDGAIATGNLKIAKIENGEPFYQMTDSGKAHVESMNKTQKK